MPRWACRARHGTQPTDPNPTHTAKIPLGGKPKLICGWAVRHPDWGRGAFCRVILDKMQGGPTEFIAESHCAVESWKNFSLKQRAGRSYRDCREERGCNGAGYQGVG